MEDGNIPKKITYAHHRHFFLNHKKERGFRKLDINGGLGKKI